jgi:hypothetical protein
MAVVFHMHDDLCRNALGLTVTQVRPCRHGVELIRLLGVEWACHGLFEDPSTMLLNGFIHGVGGEIELARPFDEPLVAMDVLEQLRILQGFEDSVQVGFPQLNLSPQAISKPDGQT